MIEKEEYLKAKQIVQEYKKQLNISGVSGSLPDRKVIEQIITDDYKRQYGTNGCEDSKEERIIGAKIIIGWLVGCNDH